MDEAWVRFTSSDVQMKCAPILSRDKYQMHLIRTLLVTFRFILVALWATDAKQIAKGISSTNISRNCENKYEFKVCTQNLNMITGHQSKYTGGN